MAGEINFGILNTNAPMQAVNALNEGASNRRKSRLEELAAQQAEQQFSDNAAYRDAYKQSGHDQNALLRQLQASGLYKQANELQKQKLEEEAKRATIAKDNSVAGKNKVETESGQFKLTAEKHDRAIRDISSFQTPEEAFSSLDMYIRSGEITPEAGAKTKASIPTDPAQFSAWKQKTLASLMSAKERIDFDKPQPKEVNLGNRVAFIDMNPNSQTFKKEVSSSSVAMSPGEAARVGLEQQRIGQAERHFQIGQANKANPAQGKPMPASALKMQQEELDAIGTASSINADMSGVENLIKSGKLDLGLVSNAAGAARNYLGVSNESSKNLASFKATLEKMRNDSLRLNKGVQTDGDAQRAWNELLTNINDKEVVKQRLGEIKRINDRALNIRKMNVDNIRRNYNAPEIDTSGYENQRSAIGGSGGDVHSQADAILRGK